MGVLFFNTYSRDSSGAEGTGRPKQEENYRVQDMKFLRRMGVHPSVDDPKPCAEWFEAQTYPHEQSRSLLCNTTKESLAV